MFGKSNTSTAVDLYNGGSGYARQEDEVDMARLQWCHICDHAFLDQHGKPCLIGLFDRILTARLPALHPQAAVAFRLTGEPGEGASVRIRLLPPGPEQPLVDVTNPRVDLGPAGIHDAVLALHDLRFQFYGDYELRIDLDGDPITAALFVVEQPIVQ